MAELQAAMEGQSERDRVGGRRRESVRDKETDKRERNGGVYKHDNISMSCNG